MSGGRSLFDSGGENAGHTTGGVVTSFTFGLILIELVVILVLNVWMIVFQFLSRQESSLGVYTHRFLHDVIILRIVNAGQLWCLVIPTTNSISVASRADSVFIPTLSIGLILANSMEIVIFNGEFAGVF